MAAYGVRGLTLQNCRLLQTYVSACGGTFDEAQKIDLRDYLSREKDVASWVLNAEELRVLRTAAA